MRRSVFFALILIAASSTSAFATVFATVRGVVHDSEHRPISGAVVTLQSDSSEFTLHATTSAEGEFDIPQAPIGIYRLTISSPGFANTEQSLNLASGTNPILHIALSVSGATESVQVHAPENQSALDTVTPATLVTRAEIEETPGAGRTLGAEMITDYVPGAYMTHDMLHIRGGHQTSWLIDGVSIPNTKIASNVGPQIDPKDIDSLETLRGSYAAGIGDRTDGVFNVLPRNGFERSREAEILLSGGNLDTGEAQISLGDHSSRTAWYGSLNAARSKYGLATPVPEIDHDQTNSASGFLSLIRNLAPKDQLRVDGQYRQDFFQIPYDPNPNDWEQASQYYESYGLRDAQTERDSFLIANWIHTISPSALVSFAPFYHFNQSNYDSPAADYPIATTWHQSSNYVGAQGDAHLDAGHNSLSAGFYSFYQAENDLFGLVINDQSYVAGTVPNTASSASAALVEFYIDDHLRLGRHVTLLGGERISIYRGALEESAIYPRIGATIEIPRLHWMLRGFYGHFFQPAPIETVSNTFLQYVTSQPETNQNAFIPLPSERDEEQQFGIQIPWRGWSLDVDTFRNRVNNVLDHSNVGESNIYFPISVDGALVRAWELSIRSPHLAHFGQFHLAYSNQIAEQRGNIVGGFACSTADNPACNSGFDYVPMDHDQRNTLNTGFTASLPWHSWLSTNVYYGSGFSNGLADSGIGPYQAAHLPVHTTLDISAGRSFGENWKLSANILNLTNHRVLLDNSVTIGGFHYNDPRMFSAELRYRFHF